MECKVCCVQAKVGNLHLNWVEDVVKLREEERDWTAVGTTICCNLFTKTHFYTICTKGVWFLFGCFVLRDIF